jgi:hypothetical protein
MLFPYSGHFTLENPSTGVKHSITNPDVLTSTNLTLMPSRITTGMAIKTPACPPMLESSTEARWCSKAR